MRKLYISKIFHLFIMMIFTIISCSLDTTPKKLANESKITVKPDLFSSSQVKLDKFRKVSFKSESIKKSNKSFSTKATGSLFSGGVISTMPNSSDIIIDIDANEDETWSLDFSTLDPNCGFQIVSSPHSGVGPTRLTLSIGGPWPDGVYTIALNGSPIGSFEIKNEQSITIEKISEDDNVLKLNITPLTEDPYAYEIAGFGSSRCITVILSNFAINKSLFPPGTYTFKAYMMKYPDISSSISFTVNPTATPTPSSSPSVSTTPTATSTPTPSSSPTSTPTINPTPSSTPTNTPTSTPTPTVNPTPTPSASPSNEPNNSSLILSKNIISTKEQNEISLDVIVKSQDKWNLFLEGTSWQTSGTGQKNISILDSRTFGSNLADGSYNFKLVNNTSSETVSSILKIDNTKPEIENFDIKESENSNLLEIKLNDKLENGVSSGVDENSIILESDGKIIKKSEYTILNNLISYNIKKSEKIDKIVLKYSDNVKNSDSIEIPVISASVGTESDLLNPPLAAFNTKASNNTVPSYLLGVPCTKIPYVVYIKKPEKSSLVVGRIGHSIVYTRGQVKVKNTNSYVFSKDYLPQYNGYVSKEEWNGLTLSGSVAPSGRYKLQVNSLLATYLPRSFTYSFDQITTFIFDGKSIEEVKSDAIKNVLNKKNIFDHIFQTKHRFDELIQKNPGLTKEQIVTDVLNKIDFCTLKEGTFQANYNQNYPVNLYGTTIIIYNATWNNNVFTLADMFIPTGAIIPNNG